MGKQIAVCLLSGGIDSAVAAAMFKRAGTELYVLSIDYGQVMQRELTSAQAISDHFNPVERRVVELRGFEAISRSARTDQDLIDRDRQGTLGDGIVPSAYPPGRDFTFISIAAAWAESLILRSPDHYSGADVIIGTNMTDSLDYPDCQEVVYERFTELLRCSLKMCKVLGKDIRVVAPLIHMTKENVVAHGEALGVPLELTWSCYFGGERACGRCDACRIRFHAFKRCGLSDQVRYEMEFPTPLDTQSASGSIAS